MQEHDRRCVVCGAVLERRSRESPGVFAQRLTCSQSCKSERIWSERRQKRAEMYRALASTTGELVLPSGHRAYVDPEDFERVIHYGWSVKSASGRRTTYVEGSVDGRRVLLHQFVLGLDGSVSVDHIDRDGMNCRKANLRVATPRQNAMNRARYKKTKSGFKGVYPSGNRWKVIVDSRYRGQFATPEEAAREYDRIAREEFGEFARVNFPDE